MKVLFLLLSLLFAGSNDTSSGALKAYIAEGPSMEPTIHAKDRFWVDTDYYAAHSVERGDLIVYETAGGKFYVKRVVGLPGDTVSMENNRLYVNGQEQNEPYIETEVQKATQAGRMYNMDFDEKTVGSGGYFVLGDNRVNSLDSRMSGSIPEEHIIGKVVRIRQGE
ncbi:MAG: signal peptidase [Paenibacillaceae bacterium]|jgi:signal peptidase I|nr:signal peptidase [Paenibacillaceae bacterium]